MVGQRGDGSAGENVFQMFVEKSPDAVFVQTDGRFVYVNPAAVRVFGAGGPDDLVGHEVVERFDASRHGFIRERICRLNEDREAVSQAEHPAIRLDGSRFYAEVSAAPISFGGKDGALVFLRDVTGRKNAEAERQETEARFRQLFDNMADGVAIYGAVEDGRDFSIVDINRSGETLSHVKRGDIVGRCVTEVFPGVEEMGLLGVLRRVWGTGEPEHLPLAEYRDSRLVEWVENYVFRLPSGLVAALYSDTSAERRARAELEETERRLSLLMANLPGMAYRCRWDAACASPGHWVMEFVSEGCRELTGYDPGDLLDNNALAYADLIHPEDRGNVADAVEDAVRRGEAFQMTYRLVTRGGQEKWVLEKGAGVFRDGKAEALEGFIMDVSAQKRSEEERLRLDHQILQTQKLESLGVLAGGIAHDFNNILMAILGHAELAMDDAGPLSPACESLRQIETAARRAADLCRQMLAYSGQASFSQEPMDLNELVEEMAHLLRTSISKGVILNIRPGKGLPEIFGDPGQLRQVVMNLIMNASEAIGDRSGTITVSLGSMDCDGGYLSETYLENDLAPGRYVHIEVSDTGCGMDAETRRRIFEPFFTTKFAGRGLGLAAVLGIVRAHKGALKVYSEPGHGTTFKVLFPALDGGGERGDGERRGKADRWRGKGTVLLVDDEPSLRVLGSRMLARMGFEVLTAGDGREAVDVYRERGDAIDLVLLDLTMPHLDGTQAFGELRRIRPDVRVVLVSGYSEQDVSSRFMGKGLAGVMQKPYSMEKLREILSGLLPSAEGAD